MAESNGTTLEELVSKWTIKTDLTPLEQGRQALKGLAGSLGLLAAQVVAGAGTLYEIAKHTAEAGDQAAKAAVKYGLLATEYQGLKYAARSEGEFLDMGLLFLNKAMSEASKGAKEAKESFAGLGVSISSGGKLKSSYDVLLQIADKFKTMPNDARRTKAAVELFGRSGASLIPFLTRGASEIAGAMKEAADFGFIIQDTEGAEEFNDTMEDLQNIMKGFRNTIGVGLIPVIQDLMNQFKEFLRVNRQLIVSGLKDFISEVVYQVKMAVLFFWNLYNAVKSLSAMFGGFGKAVRAVTRALQAMVAIAAIYYIGRLTQSTIALTAQLYKMALAWHATGWAAMIAQIKMLAIPLAIGAAIVAVLLIMEDLFTFFSGGGESLTGDLVKLVGDGMKWLGQKMIELGAWINENINAYVANFANKLTSWFQPVMDWITRISNGITNLVNGSSFMKWATKLSASVTTGVAGAMAYAPTAGGAMGLNPTMTSIGQSYEKAVVASQPTINQTINMGANADPLATGKAVGGETKNAMDQSHREAARSFSAQGEY